MMTMMIMKIMVVMMMVMVVMMKVMMVMMVNGEGHVGGDDEGHGGDDEGHGDDDEGHGGDCGDVGTGYYFQCLWGEKRSLYVSGPPFFCLVYDVKSRDIEIVVDIILIKNLRKPT